MAEEIIFKTSVETGNSVKSVNDLDKAVNNVGNSVEDTQGEFTRLRQEITKQGKEVDALSKKYGDNSKEADLARKSLAGLNVEYASLSKSAVDLGAIFDDVYGEMLPLSTQISEMEDRMYELARANETSGTEFQTLKTKVADYKKIIIETDRAVDMLAEQGRGLGTALQLGTAVTAGYGVLQGGMALLGKEGEDLQKTFVKLQAVQAVLTSLEQLKLSLDKQSILVTKAKAVATGVMTGAQYLYTTAVGTTTGAMKALRVAMMAIPIVAIIAGIVALIAVIYELMTATIDYTKVNDDLTVSIDKVQKAQDRMAKNSLKDMDNMIATAKANGASQEELHNLEIQRMSKEEALRKRQTKIYSAELQARKVLYQNAVKQEDTELAKQIKEQIQATREKYKDIKDLDGQYEIDKKNKQTEFDRQEAENAKAEREKRNSAWQQAQATRKAEEERLAKEKLDRDRLLTDMVINNIDDEILRARAKMDTEHARQTEDLIAKYGQDTELIKQLEATQASEVDAFNAELQAQRDADQAERTQAEADQKAIDAERLRADERAGLELKLMQMSEDFEATQALQRELDEIKMQEELAQLDLTENEKELIKEKYRQIDEQREEDLAQKKKDLAKDIAEQSFGIANQLMSSMQSISDSIYETQLNGVEKGSAQELAIRKKQFESNKKMQIANAVISGIQGALTAFTGAMQLGPIAGPIVGGVLAAVVGVTTALNVNKIKSTKFDSGGGGSVGAQPRVSMPSIPTASELIGGENEGTATAGLQGSGTETVNETQVINVKATVVDSELKAGLDSYDKSLVTSSFG